MLIEFIFLFEVIKQNLVSSYNRCLNFTYFFLLKQKQSLLKAKESNVFFIFARSNIAG